MNEEKRAMEAYAKKILLLETTIDDLKENHFKALEYWQDEYSKLLNLSQRIKEENAALKSKMDDIHNDLERLMENIHT